MECQQCVDEGKKSSVEILFSRTTLMGGRQFYDEDGKYHSHDPNYRTTALRCSNGHDWTVVEPSRRCWCQQQA